MVYTTVTSPSIFFYDLLSSPTLSSLFRLQKAHLICYEGLKPWILISVDAQSYMFKFNRHFCLQRITEKQNMVVITDRMWARLLSSTNQPSFLRVKDIEEIKKEEQPQTQLLDGITMYMRTQVTDTVIMHLAWHWSNTVSIICMCSGSLAVFEALMLAIVRYKKS